MAFGEEVKMTARHAASADGWGPEADGGLPWGDEMGAHATSSKQMPYSTTEFRTEIARVKRKRRVVATLCAVAVALIALIVVLALAFGIPQSLHTVTTSDMNPALSEGQVVITQRINAPDHGDIVIYRDGSGKEQFGRVLAVAGEWANLSSDGSVVISDVTLEGSESSEVVKAGSKIVISQQVPNASCFIVTDKAMESDDLIASFDNPVGYRSIIGRVTHRAWPLFA